MVKNKKNKAKFIRFGGLSSVKQKGYDPSMPGMHSPPARKGIYAFVWPHIVPFMLGGETWSGIKSKHSKMEYVKDKTGKIEEVNENLTDWTEVNFLKKYSTVEKDGKEVWIKPKQPKTFTYEGEIWHHLGSHLKPNQIVKTKGSWYLTSYQDWEKAFEKEKHSILKQYHKIWLKDFKQELEKIELNNPFRFFVKDHLEVFIEKV
jgi:hypothetical protein